MPSENDDLRLQHTDTVRTWYLRMLVRYSSLIIRSRGQHLKVGLEVQLVHVDILFYRQTHFHLGCLFW